MADMDDAGPHVVGSAEEMAELLPLASILREMLDDFIAGSGELASGMRSILKFAAPHLASLRSESVRGSKGLKRQAVEGGAACGHICPQHPAELDATVWSRLPEEILEQVFAKLPVPEVYRLRCLSKQWQQNMNEKSRFKDICAETNSNIFALISEDADWNGVFWVKLYDIKTNKWHVFRLFVGDTDEEPYKAMNATDGGLVCFISTWKATEEHPLQVVVCNPLTQDVRSFLLNGSTHHVEMMQIVTNRDTGHYKIVVVAREQFSFPNYERLAVDLFDSRTDDWITLDWPAGDRPLSRDLFFGIRYSWDLEGSGLDDNRLESDCLGPCVWDCAQRNLNSLNDDSNPLRGITVEDYALVGDRMFVLHEVSRRCESPGDPNYFDDDDQDYVDDDWDNVADDGNSDDADDPANLPSEFMTDQYCISEYQGQTGSRTNWVMLRSINCSPFELPPSKTDYGMRLHACQGFLLVVAHNDEWHSPYDHQIGWLYEFSTNEWRALPNLPGGVKFHDFKDNLLCELRWDVDLNPLNTDIERSFLPVLALSEC